jgi:phosphate starvation-inducible PhoH-like protein
MSRKRSKKIEQEIPFEIILKNKSQEEALEKIKNNTITFLLGPAGTGKTYLAIAESIYCLITGRCSKIIISKPMVPSCSEDIGYLPGSAEEKIAPYLLNIKDFIVDMIGQERYEELLYSGQIEIVQLAFIRGRTFSGHRSNRKAGAIIILDEAQNCSRNQLEMALTRIGFNSKYIITADPDQSDKKLTQIKEIAEKLSKIESISLYEFEEKDIVRHPLIGKILNVFKEIN